MATSRYHHHQLNLLQNTQHETFYRSKRNHSGFRINRAKNYSEDQDRRQARINNVLSFQQSQREVTSSHKVLEVSLGKIKEKLTQYLTPTPHPKGEIQAGNKSSITPDPKKKEMFRFNNFRYHLRRQENLKMLESPEHHNMQDLNKNFQIKQARITKRMSLNQTKLYEQLGFTRDCLKYYGENKCFQKAVQFKVVDKIKKIESLDKNSPFMISQKLKKYIDQSQQVKAMKDKSEADSLRDCSLEYSSEFQASGVEPWKRVIRQLEWSEFADLQNQP